MRTAVILAAVAHAAIASAIPAFQEPASVHSFDKRDDFTPAALGGKILTADLYAGVAGLNQQLYQATEKPDQWKKCNPLNIVVRREWYGARRAHETGSLMIPGPHSQLPTRATTFLQCNAWQNCRRRPQNRIVRAARTATMTLWRLISSKPLL